MDLSACVSLRVCVCVCVYVLCAWVPCHETRENRGPRPWPPTLPNPNPTHMPTLKDVGWYLDQLVAAVTGLAERWGVPGCGTSEHGVGVWLTGSPTGEASVVGGDELNHEGYRSEDRKVFRTIL